MFQPQGFIEYNPVSPRFSRPAAWTCTQNQWVDLNRRFTLACSIPEKKKKKKKEKRKKKKEKLMNKNNKPNKDRDWSTLILPSVSVGSLRFSIDFRRGCFGILCWCDSVSTLIGAFFSSFGWQVVVTR